MKWSRFSWMLSILAALLSTQAASADIFRVNDDAAPGGSGGSWGSAIRYLQDAFEAAAETPGDDEIWVAAGIYYPDEDEGANQTPNDREARFQLLAGVRMYGGFAGNEDSRSQRNPEKNVTTLSGDIDQNDGPGPFQNNANNSYQVVRAEGVGSTTIINGFTITAGNGTGSEELGGAMRIVNSNVRVVRCIFKFNKAGGTFTPTLYPGGGIFIVGDSQPAVVNCSFLMNQAWTGGGVASFGNSNHTLTNCVFYGNDAGDGGAGMVVGTREDEVFHTVYLNNCTFVENEVLTGEGGGLSVYGTNNFAYVQNCIFWNDDDGNDGKWPYITKEIFAGPGPVPNRAEVHYTCIEEGYLGPGSNNIDADPLFCDQANGNLRLTDNSPCIDVASDGNVPSDIADVDEDGNVGEPTPWDRDNEKPLTQWGRFFNVVARKTHWSNVGALPPTNAPAPFGPRTHRMNRHLMNDPPPASTSPPSRRCWRGRSSKARQLRPDGPTSAVRIE